MKKLIKQVQTTLKTCLVVSCLSMTTYVSADDTEIFYSVNIANNLLFVLDVSGSMSQKIVSTTTTTNGVTTVTSGGGSSASFDRPTEAGEADASQTFPNDDDDDDSSDAGEQDLDDEILNFKLDNVVATRFRDGDNRIRKGAKIVEAWVTFTSDDDYDDETEIQIKLEDVADDFHYDTYSEYDDYKKKYYENNDSTPKVSERPTYGLVTWTPGEWEKDEKADTPDLKELVQHLVDKADWYLNSFAFHFTTIKGDRAVFAKESDSDEAEFNLKYRNPVCLEWDEKESWEDDEEEDVCVNISTTEWESEVKEFDKDVKKDNDDVEQNWIDNSVPDQVHDENILVLDDNRALGLRFVLIDNPDDRIPKDSVITKAYLQFTSAGNYTDPADINIQIEDTGFAKDYSSSNPKIRDRSYHVGSATQWNLESSDAWVTDEKDLPERTVDVTDQVQHVVDRSDWANGLAFMLFNETADSERKFYAYDEGADKAPVLHVEYQNINGATTGTTTTDVTTTVTRVDTRLNFMKEALREVLADAPNFNVGLMKYSGMRYNSEYGSSVAADNKRKHYVGGIVVPIAPIYSLASDIISTTSQDNLPDPSSTITLRDYIPDVADQWEPRGGTPIVDALYEAALYYRGEKMHYGKERNIDENIDSTGSHPSSYFGGTAISKTIESDGRSAISDRFYKSPIKNECSSNFIVLMSDGAPTYYYRGKSNGANKGPFARALKGLSNDGVTSGISSCLAGNGEDGNTGTNLEAGTCGREITQFLANNDQMPDDGRGENAGVEGEQNVKTFTIGFGQGLEDGAREYLQSLETADGNGYYEADDKEGLKEAFKKIFKAVTPPTGSLASPGYSVNVKSGLEHEKDIYIPVFARKNSARWSGNLKKFRIEDVSGKRKIKSRTGNDAVDELGGFNNDPATGAIDYWSKTTDANPDGEIVEKGGLASLLDPAERNLYSNLDCASSPSSGCTLKTNNNRLNAANAEDAGKIENLDLGITDTSLTDAEKETKRIQLVNFITGWNDGNTSAGARKHMGDMLHSEPIVITYKKGDDAGVGKEQYIFAGTNEGFLHAFNTAHTGASAGKEIFAFMPKELLKNIDPQFRNTGLTTDHKYGIDGVLSYWHDDKNKNGEVDVATEKVYLYFGLRRGGNSFYALDVTDINNPKFLWANTKSSGALSHMGQSWSTPYLARVRMSDGVKKEVLIVSGGYDTADDRDKPGDKNELNDSTTAVTVNEGNDIFIFDAKTGDLIWSVRESLKDTSSLTSSIPGGMRILDINGNGVIDRMYFADTGGDVWRLDLSESLGAVSASDNVSSLTKLASLGTVSSSNARKFFNEPDVARLKVKGKSVFMISVGSGYRAHPQDKTIHDNFYVLQDTSPYEALSADYDPIIHGDGDSDGNADLASVSISGSAGSLSVTPSGFGEGERGWYLNLPEDGEKVLSSSITFDGVISFTTLIPAVLVSDENSNIDVCEAPVTQGRLYALNILTGKAGLNLDESVDEEGKPQITDNDVFSLVTKEIPGTPQIVFNNLSVEEEKDDEGNVTKTSCTHPVDIRIGKKLSQATGYEACRLESVYWSNPQEN